MQSLRKIILLIKNNVRKALSKGLIHIVFSSFFNKAIMFIANIAIIRLMSQEEYGIYTFAYNIISVVLIVSSLGLDVALMQFCSEQRNDEEKNQIKKTTLSIGIVSNIIFVLGIIIYTVSFPLSLPEGKRVLVSLAAILPFPFLLNCTKNILRANLDNKRYALLTNIASVSYLVSAVGMIIPFGIWGMIIGRYLGYIIPLAIGVVLIRNELHQLNRSSYADRKIVRSILSYGITVALTNGVSELLYYLDVYVVGVVTTDATSIAMYKTATVIPNGMAALPFAIMVFIYPYFARNKDNTSWVRKNLLKIQSVLFPLSAIVAIIFVVFAPNIINIVYGDSYSKAVIPFRILMIGFVFSATFKVVGGNVLAMLGKVKINFVFGCIECLLNIVLDYFLVKKYGSIGAAIATTSIIFMSSVITNTYLYTWLSKTIKLNR